MKAITTIRALSLRLNHGLLPRPPAENRIKLYGLYKQATEGNVQGIMPRPEGHTLEDEGAKKKWDAWKREEGLSKTEAKRRYILYLIDTMKVYASGTAEARELLGELEYLWDQIKDVEFSEEEVRAPYPYNIAPLVASNVDQSDRYLTGTPWPLQSNYSALVTNQQYRSNLEQMYLHSRVNTQLLVNEYVQQQRAQGIRPAGPASVPLARKSVDVPASTLEDFRAWQGQINLIINRLSREFARRRSPFSDTESEGDEDPRTRTRRMVVRLLKTVGWQAVHFVKNTAIALVTILFVVWFVKKNVVVQRTVVRKQLEGRRQKELVINMVINTDENKWFVRLLSLLNSFVGFV